MNWPVAQGGQPAHPLPAWPELDEFLEEMDEFDSPEPPVVEPEEELQCV